MKMKWMFRFIRPYKIRWILGMFCDILATVAGLILCSKGMEYLLQGIFDREWHSIMMGIICEFAHFLVLFVFFALFNLLSGVSSAGIRSGLRGAVFYKLLKLPMGKDDDGQLSSQITYLNQDVDLVMRLYMINIRIILRAIILGIAVLTGIMMRHVLTGIICGFVFLGNTISNLYFMPRQEAVVKERQKSLAKLNSMYNDTFSGSMVIKVLGLKSMMISRIGQAADGVSDIKKKERRLSLKQSAFSEFFLVINFALPLILGIYLNIKGEIAFGAIFYIIQMTQSYMLYCRELGDSIKDISKSYAGLDRLYELFNKPDELDRYGCMTNVEPVNNVIELEHVNISYGDKRVVHDLSLTLNSQETTALVGGSGSGKSSIIKAVLQFAEHDGVMKLYGRDTSEYSLSSLRDSFAYVEQDARLFNGSVYENILYGNPSATADEVYEASKKAFANDFILNLPNGYDTIIGENGYKLSGGERQRLAIARAFLKNAPILLLDEATSALDSVSEQKVQEAIEELMKGRTILVVAHRLSTIRKASHIVVLEQGRVVESGSHQELLQKGGRYKELYNMQFSA